MPSYGANPPHKTLAPTTWNVANKSAPGATPTSHLTLHHLTLSTACALPGLFEYLHLCFSAEIERGLTYPLEAPPGETLSEEAFKTHFFPADVIVGILNIGERVVEDSGEAFVDIEEARGPRTWEESIAGFYYVKPNYPGRSSHICNAGFVVPFSCRRGGYGSVLARSFLYYGPRLGYQASIYNIVFVNNIASIKLWERLLK